MRFNSCVANSNDCIHAEPLFLRLALLNERGDEVRAAHALTKAVDALEATDVQDLAEIQVNNQSDDSIV